MPRRFSVGLIGFGNVGRSFVRELLERREDILKRYGVDVRVSFVADSRGVLYGSPFLGDGRLSEALRVERGRVSELPGGASGEAATEAIVNAAPDAIVEATPSVYDESSHAVKHFKTAIELGADVITANKAPLALKFAEVMRLADRHGCRVLFKACVMAGAPLVDVVRFGLLGRRVVRFVGVLNVTSNYIISLVEGGASFSEALKSAVAAGYAEPDPELDLKGIDLAAKGSILYSVAVSPLTIYDVTVRDVVDEGVVRRLRGNPRRKLRYVVEFSENSRPVVKLYEATPGDPLYELGATENAAVLLLDDGTELTFKASKLGPRSTAVALMSDVLLAARLRFGATV